MVIGNILWIFWILYGTFCVHLVQFFSGFGIMYHENLATLFQRPVFQVAKVAEISGKKRSF
jgi:hypothetical protein